jgi:hypothetical protein
MATLIGRGCYESELLSQHVGGATKDHHHPGRYPRYDELDGYAGIIAVVNDGLMRLERRGGVQRRGDGLGEGDFRRGREEQRQSQQDRE